jgi:hypothetical protein
MNYHLVLAATFVILIVPSYARHHGLEDYFSGTAAVPGDLGLASKFSPMGSFEDLLQKGNPDMELGARSAKGPVASSRAANDHMASDRAASCSADAQKDLGIFGPILQLNNPFIHWLFVELGGLFNGQIPFSELSFILPDYIIHIHDYIQAIESNQLFVRMKQETLTVLKVVIAILNSIVANNRAANGNQHFSHFLEALKQFQLVLE